MLKLEDLVKIELSESPNQFELYSSAYTQYMADENQYNKQLLNVMRSSFKKEELDKLSNYVRVNGSFFSDNIEFISQISDLYIEIIEAFNTQIEKDTNEKSGMCEYILRLVTDVCWHHCEIWQKDVERYMNGLFKCASLPYIDEGEGFSKAHFSSDILRHMKTVESIALYKRLIDHHDQEIVELVKINSSR